MEFILTFIILGITIVLFVSNLFRADLVSLLALLALVLTGILDPKEALSGFSNSTVIMIAALFVVGAGITRTGLAKKAGTLLIKWSKKSEKRLFLLLLCIVVFVGAFMSNTGTVAIMLPVVISIALSIKANASKYLIPLAYAASLSGLMTLIASPPNLIVSQALEEHGFEKLSFFDITPIGIIASLTGIIYLYLVRNHLLPKGENKRQRNNKVRLKDLIQHYHLEDFIFHVEVTETSPIVGRQLAKLKIPSKYQVAILKIERRAGEGKNLLPITYQEMAGPKSVIHANDILYVQGPKHLVDIFVNDFELKIHENSGEDIQIVSKQLGIAEVLLTPNSNLINQTLEKIKFREKYNLNVIGINRRGNYILKEMSSIKLRFGDALLVQGAWDDIELLSGESKDVVVVGQPKEHASIAATTGKAPIAAAIVLFMVLLMVFEIFPTVISAIIGAVLMILTGCLRNMDDAYDHMNWESLVLIACMLPLATALEKTGGMEFLSNGIIQIFGGLGPLGVMAGIYLAAMILGQFISNTATAVLFSPIAMNAAMAMDLNPYPFAIAVAVASSMAFTTPVASPTNAMVMTAGDYKFTDFVKVGVPLQIVMFVVMMIFIPFIYKL